MPKDKKKPFQRTNGFANKFKSNGIVAEGVNLLCRPCGTVLGNSSIMKSQIDQHVKSKNHNKNVKLHANQRRIDEGVTKPYLRDLRKVSQIIQKSREHVLAVN